MRAMLNALILGSLYILTWILFKEFRLNVVNEEEFTYVVVNCSIFLRHDR